MIFSFAPRRGACCFVVASTFVAFVARAADLVPGSPEAPEPTSALGKTSADSDTEGEQAVELPEQEIRLRRNQPTDPTSSATVVDVNRFKGEAKSVAELVSTSPGVSIRDEGGLGQLATVSIRGSTSDEVKVFLDGLPLNTAAGGGVDLSSIPRHWISSIEVIRGPEGAQYGAGALGGVVNVVTRSTANPGYRVLAGGGAFGTYTLGVDGSTGGPGWGGVMALSLDRSAGDFPYVFETLPSVNGGVIPRIRAHNGSESGGLLAKGFVETLGGREDALLQVSGGARQVPGAPYEDAFPAVSLERSGRIAAAVRDSRKGPLDSLLETTLTLRGDALNLDTLTSPTTIERGEWAGLSTQVSGSKGFAAASIGASAAGERLSEQGLGPTRQRANLAAFASAELSAFERHLLVTPSLRAESVGPFDGLSGRLGVSTAIAGPLSLRASGGRTFRAPSFSELYLVQALLAPNPDLRPETAWGGDAALVAQGSLGLMSVGVFESLYDDLIIYAPRSFDTYGPENDLKALMRGVEGELATAPRGPLNMEGQLAATFQDSRTLWGSPDEVGRQLPRRPTSQIFARLGGDRGPFGASVEVQRTGRQWLDPSEMTGTPVATTVNVGVFWRVFGRRDLRLEAVVRNLFDVETLEDGFGNPLPGRWVMVTLLAEGGPKEQGER